MNTMTATENTTSINNAENAVVQHDTAVNAAQVLLRIEN